MADTKISALTGATTPLNGTEVLPIVQSGTTKKVSVADLTAGRAISAKGMALNGFGTGTTGGNLEMGWDGTQTVIQGYNRTSSAYVGLWLEGSYTRFGIGGVEAARFDTSGNLVPAIAAKGINFTANTPAAGMTSQLLNWYEEGTFTAGFTCGSGSITLKSSFNTCAYTRIGRQVTVTGYLEVDSVSSPSGTLLLTGLPFTIKNANSAYPTGAPFLNTTGAITGTPVMLGYANTTTVSFRRITGGSAVDDMAGFFGAGSQIIFTFVYIV